MLSAPFKALVMGASGGVGRAFCEHLQSLPSGVVVIPLSRASDPAIDLCDEASIATAASALATAGPFDVIMVCTGFLHGSGLAPEKKLSDLSPQGLMHNFRVNTIGPALILRYFTPLLSKQRGRMGFLSARVGSIADNRLGGWYSYRSSKAALNMLIKTAAIELQRTHPGAALVALHPGTVNTSLSQPFGGEQKGRSPQAAAADLWQVMLSLTPQDTGRFLSFDGQSIAW